MGHRKATERHRTDAVHARRLGGRWQLAARKGTLIDLQADLMRFTVDAIAGQAFGAEVDTQASVEDVIQRHLNRIFPAVFSRIFAPLPLWRWFPSQADKALVRSVAEVHAAVDGFIAQARARLAADPSLRANPQNLLEAMPVAADEPGSGMDDKQVAGSVLTMLLAFEGTTANGATPRRWPWPPQRFGASAAAVARRRWNSSLSWTMSKPAPMKPCAGSRWRRRTACRRCAAPRWATCKSPRAAGDGTGGTQDAAEGARWRGLSSPVDSAVPSRITAQPSSICQVGCSASTSQPQNIA
jgi:hypothetical protein